ncbi:Aquaporin [Thalictrum thalictroides]|uniref:Aquaporin n=1 Tax=Thalictrum thalictroides TaxID=46969 RepID=A0A7J6XF55_THATH|nr:Aquaporin [Thalictrum thalictroides]
MERNGSAMDEESQFNSKVQSIDFTPSSVDWKNAEKKSILSNFRNRLGLEDFYSYKVWQASMAELLGTAILVFGIDTIVIASFETDTKQPNLILSILVAVLIAILLLATIPVSGGHINPVVTFSAALLGLITISRAIIYILAQCLGGVLGALALKAVIGNSIEHTFSLGGCTVTVIAPGPDGPTTVGLDRSAVLWLEIICTFVVLFASVWMAFDARQAKALGHVTVCAIVGIVMGLMVFVSTTVTTKRGYSGVGMHPARCFGPAVVRGGHLWNEHWIFWVGPTISCIAFYMYIKIIPKEHFKH